MLPIDESMRASRRVNPSEVTVRTDPSILDESPCDVRDRIGILPKRAAAALDLGLCPDNPGFHIYVACEPEVMIDQDILLAAKKAAERLAAPSDVIYVHDFDRPEAPRPLLLPAGMGRDFANAIDQMMTDLQRRLASVGSIPAIRDAQTALARELSSKNKQVVADLEAFAKSLGFGVKTVPGGVQTFPILHGKPVSPEQFEVLDESTKRVLSESEGELASAVENAAKRIREMTEEVNAASDDAMQKAAEDLIAEEVAPLHDRFDTVPYLAEYIEQLERQLARDWPDFVEPVHEQPQPCEGCSDTPREPDHGDPEIATRTGRFQINLYVSHNGDSTAPVVYEANPTFPNLFGYLERRARYGMLVTDYTRIRSGSLCRASGGYLLLRANDLLTDPIIWERFKRVLRDHQLAVEDPLGPIGMYATTLRPRPAALKVRVILIGPHGLFEQLLDADPDFASLFRVKVEIDWRVPRTEQTLRAYDGYVMSLDNLRKARGLFDRSARARLLDFAVRLAGDKEQIALTPGPLEETACFAALRACEHAGTDATITGEHVEAAWFERRDRSAGIEREMREFALRGDLLVDLNGTRVGVVNGISVFSAGDVEFGQPMRITAVVSLGREGVIDVEREAQLGGSLHTKGLAIARGFLSHMFGQERPLSLRVQIAFEQSYGEVDGDSASAAELFAILSALADVGIDQGIAVTGSVNQLGEIQAIGGVCAKVEGFYDLAEGRGLTGSQGVCIPRANVKNLVLRPDVTKAIEEGKFHLYAISDVAEGIEVLTGLSAGVRDSAGRFLAGSVFGRVERRLIELAELLRSAEAGPVDRGATVDATEGDKGDGGASFMGNR